MYDSNITYLCIYFLPVTVLLYFPYTSCLVFAIRIYIHYIFINNIHIVYDDDDDDFIRFVSGKGIKIYCYFVSTKMGICVCVRVCE